jgi:NitT/TauT family transport system permease protein
MNLFKLRQPPSLLGRAVAGGICLLLLLLVWTILTAGDSSESRIVSASVLPSPAETFHSFGSLWFDRALSRNILISLWRIVEGFGLAALIGVPLGILCGTWPWINALLAPITVFGRNVPMSALVPLTLLWFGIDEKQKVMFIFIACVAFVVFDSARAIASVHEQFVQTALTLGASRMQVVAKVLVPLALPEIFGSLRLLFGLAFGYIILAEMVNMTGGLGDLILESQRRGPREHVYIILVIIALIAYGLDRLLFFTEQKLFPYREE